MTRALVTFGFACLAGCGNVAASSDEAKPSEAPAATEQPTPTPVAVNEEAVKGKAKLQFFEKAIFVDDELFELSCNQYFFKFAITKDLETCKPVTVETDLQDNLTQTAWAIRSSDTVSVNLNGLQEDDEEQIKFGSTTYRCYLYTGSMYRPSDGATLISGEFLLFASEAADKPSEVDPNSVLAIGFNDNDACDGVVEDP